MSDTDAMKSNIHTGLSPHTTKLADSQFLKDLGYNLDPSTWPELQSLYQKALKEDKLLRSLYITIKEQRDRASDQLKHYEGDKNLAQENLVCGIAQLFKKFTSCWLAVSKVQVMAGQQSNRFVKAMENGDLEVDSLLVPGKRITLNHDAKEREDFIRSLWALSDADADDGNLGEDGSAGRSETDPADSDGFLDEAEFWCLGDSPDVSRSFEA
ncbi:MAG: hypothetical protein Q9207_008300 [Kuettlingeria erythrocarpa]